MLNDHDDLCLLALLLSSALACFYAAAFTLALPWPKSWLKAKPLGCPTCMAGWAAIGGWYLLGEPRQSSILFWAAVAGLTRLLMAMQAYFEPPMPELPPGAVVPLGHDAGSFT